MAATAGLAVASQLDAGRGDLGTRGAVGDASSRVGSGRALSMLPAPRVCGSDGNLRLGRFLNVVDQKRGRGTGIAGVARAVLDSARYWAEKEAQRQQGKEDEDDDDGTCPVDCVREISTASEFEEVLAESRRAKSLVVVDFYRTACGSCKYVEKGFIKLCKGSGNDNASVVFLKHNVMDEYEEQSDIAAGFKIRNVPLFHFYKDGDLVEAFTTREKSKILAAIYKHTGRVPDVPEGQAS